MANAESAIERLYEDAAIRDSLADAEAQTLLRWAEAQIMRLANETPDETTFETQFDAIRRLVKGVNRFVGERGQMAASDLDARLADLLARGQALGAPQAAQASALAESFAAGDDASALQAVLGLLTPVDAGAEATAATPDSAEPSAASGDTPDDEQPETLQARPDATFLPAPANPPLTSDERDVDPADARHEPEPVPQVTDLWRHVSAFLKPQRQAPADPSMTAADDAPDDTGDSIPDDEAQDDWYE